MNKYNFDFHMKQEDIISSIIEGRLVPRDLSEFADVERLSNKSYIYVDNNGEPKKVSISSLKAGMVEVVDKEPKDALIGQVIFKEIK